LLISNYKTIYYKELTKFSLDTSDIIYSTVRPVQRHYGFINNPLSNLVVSTGFATITCEKDKLNPIFLYYLLSADDTVEYLDVIAEASTSAYPSLRPSAKGY
jgi:type I restriction enzyme S subunit